MSVLSTRVRRLAPLAATLALTLPLAAVVSGASAAPTGAGSPGIGDPYYPTYGNGGYDVSHYDVDIAYTPKTDTVAGRTTITATTTQALSRFDLDLVLPASTVTVDGQPATFTQKPHELVVTPPKKLAAGAPMTVVVTYAGVPSTISDGKIKPWIRTKDGAAAVGEPEMAAWWFPSNDHPRDKATYDVSVRVPSSVEVLGNGQLVSKDVKAGQRTWHWREDNPMASYLAYFVAGQFDISSGYTDDGKPVITAVASEGGSEGKYAAADLARVPEIIDFESSLWGPYPFDALGGVAPDADFGFALENQTRPVYTRSFWSGGPNIYVVVHEQAHQWYGDSVSVHNWKDIWLNEGFATFTEWMWSEKHHDGSAAKLFADTYAAHPATDDFWTTKIGNPGAGNEFTGAVYDRGAMTLQALRTKIGEPAFFTTMRTWASSRRHGNGQISQFVALAEKVSGQDLDAFFDTWLYSAERPEPTTANGFPKKFAPGGAPATSLAKIEAVRQAVSEKR
ncbi:peptidase [Marmoricola endophyticus]|uniref:Aminopeptidase N n=1 Tax=Marmoricola endophyticus TaxID=2040280 RepID=A0A917BIP2_9ACTN|nr:M1 family metallopeptidase [Marmoricola endophyticus]GGF41802.1 peptidase [Marmoricola endophyticus]